MQYINEQQVLYFEIHITIEPVENKRLELFENICKNHDFRIANLIMVKKRQITKERSNKDQFCTARRKTFDESIKTIEDITKELKSNDFSIWRSKIEAVLFDERTKNS